MNVETEREALSGVEAPNEGQWMKFWMVALGVSVFTGSVTALAMQIHPILGISVPVVGISVIVWCLFAAVVQPVEERRSELLSEREHERIGR